MKSNYLLEGLQDRNSISDIAVALHDIEGMQLVSFNGEENQLTIEYNDALADKIIEKVKELIKKIYPKANIRNIE